MSPRPVLAALVALHGLAACSETPPTVEPVIDLPTAADVQASPYPLDAITLSVAHAGSDRDLVTQTFAPTRGLDLEGVPFADDLVIHIGGFVGASNVSYARSCAFAFDAHGATVAPHLFFSRSQHFADLDLTPLPRFAGSGIAYLGTGLFIGGLDRRAGAPVTQIEKFDPVTGTLAAEVADVSPRIGAIAAIVGTSPPLIALIGGQVEGAGATFLELIDPGRRVEHVEENRLGRIGMTATSLTSGGVVVVGGRTPGTPPVDTIDVLTPMGAAVQLDVGRAMLATPRSEHTATRLGDEMGSPVLITGGLAANNLPVAIAELYKPLTGKLADPLTFSPPMLVPRWRHAAARMPDGSVLIVGGLDAIGQPVRKLELFTIDGGFSDAGDLPATAGLLDLTVTALADGRVLIAGGRATADGPPVQTTFIASLNPLNGSIDVIPTDKLATARAGHQAMLLCDGTVLVGGGTAEPAPLERYNPPSGGRR